MTGTTCYTRGPYDVTFVAASGGYVASRAGFSAGATTERGAIRAVEDAIFNAGGTEEDHEQRRLAELEWSDDLHRAQADFGPSAIEVASWQA